MKRTRAWWLSGAVTAGWVAFHAAGCSTGVAGEGTPFDASTEPEASEGATTDASTDATEDGMAADTGADAADAIAILDANDAAVDSSGECNASNCGGACCGGQCIPRTCAGCGFGKILCPYQAGAGLNSNGICVSDCAACSTGTIECFACTSDAAAVGTCAPGPDQCPTASVGGACSCPSGDAGDCPGQTQVCASAGGNSCLTCGAAGTDGLGCNNAATCNEQDAACQ